MSVAAIPRTAWQSSERPVTGPARRAPFRQGVVHYEGHGGRTRTPGDIAQHLRNIQRAYLTSRGYSLGYGYGVVSDVDHPDDGSRWEIRGTDINMASNPGRKWNAEGRQPSGNANNWTGSVLLIGPEGVPASEKAAASVRQIFTEWHLDAGTVAVRPIPHSVLDYTPCCGDPFRADIAAGRFDPGAPVPKPPTPQPETSDDMEAIFYPTYDPNAPTHKWWNAGTPHLVIWPSGAVTRATNAHYKLADLKQVPVLPLESQDQYMDLVSKIV